MKINVQLFILVVLLLFFNCSPQTKSENVNGILLSILNQLNSDDSDSSKKKFTPGSKYTLSQDLSSLKSVSVDDEEQKTISLEKLGEKYVSPRLLLKNFKLKDKVKIASEVILDFEIYLGTESLNDVDDKKRRFQNLSVQGRFSFSKDSKEYKIESEKSGNYTLLIVSSTQEEITLQKQAVPKEEVEKDTFISSWTAGWRNDDVFIGNIKEDKITIDVDSADFETKVTLEEGASITPDPNTVTDWTKEAPFTVTKGDETKTYQVKVTVDGKDIIKASDSDIQTIINNEIKKHGNTADYNHIDVSSVTNMRRLFYRKFTFNGDITKWDTSKVTNMEGMFYNLDFFNQNISFWDTSKVTNMKGMFGNAASFNQNISFWDTSKVINMERMFYGADYFNQNINSWKTNNVINMKEMFAYVNFFNYNINSWDTSNVTNMERMFYKARFFNQDISDWKTDKVTNMKEMFRDAYSFNQNINGWDVSNVTNMEGMFRDARVFNQNINSWKTNKVTNMESMFNGAEAFNQNISDWDTSNATIMSFMFVDARFFNQDISDWKTSNVTNMRSMFLGAKVFNQNISDWDTSKVTSMSSMFAETKAFNQDISGWVVNKVKYCRGFSQKADAFEDGNKPRFTSCTE